MRVKPIVRWIIGPVLRSGFLCLARSVIAFRAIYGNRFDYLICYNQLNPSQVVELTSLGIPLYHQNCQEFVLPPVIWNQSKMTGSLASQPTRNCWKLYPPRMRLDGHEIILDNDLIVRRPIEEIEEFLSGNHVIVTEGLQRSYGRLDHLVNQGLTINTGLLGMPPGFDLDVLLDIDHVPDGWQEYFDEQALIAAAIQDSELRAILRNRVCYHGEDLSRPIFHFIGLNYLYRLPFWKLYLSSHL